VWHGKVRWSLGRLARKRDFVRVDSRPTTINRAGIAPRVLAALSQLEERLAHTAPGERLRGPDYHFFTYRGFACGLVCCLLHNSRWVGFVRLAPTDVLVWPARSTERPFVTGIDFEIPYKEHTMLRGFHTMHAVYDVSLAGVRAYESVDSMAITLRSYIDTCLDQPPP